jgi:hypothetical protein
MAGVQSATLQGWSVAIPATAWEHTYVTSSCGLKWGCYGRDSGGAVLSGATGSSIIADCLSQPNSQAGIIYPITGVCHQTANRILHPAGITVAGCRGYNLSAFAFGTYGLGNWPELPTCYSPGTIPANVGSGHRPQGRNVLSKIDVYSSAVSTARGTASAEEDTRLAELSALLEMALGHPVDQPTLSALHEIQTELRRAQSELVVRFDSGELTPDRYLKLLNDTLRSTMERSRSLLGDERFQAIFGEAGRYPEGLINRYTTRVTLNSPIVKRRC